MDYTAGLDEIFSIVKTAVTCPIIWPNTPNKNVVHESVLRAYVAAYTIDDSLAAFRNATFQRRFRIRGTLIVEFLAPNSDPLSWDSAKLEAQTLRNALRAPNVNQLVWFRNARVAELPSDRMCNRLSVVANYEYDELR